MTISRTFAGAFALALAVAMQNPTLAEGAADNTQGSEDKSTVEQVWSGISETFSGIAAYTARQRDKAEAEAREAMTAIDGQIETAEQTMREQWSTLSDEAKNQYRKRLQDLRQARNQLGEQYGALEQSADESWQGLASAFSEAGADLEKAWQDLYEDVANSPEGAEADAAGDKSQE